MDILGTGIDAINFDSININTVKDDMNVIKNIPINLIEIGCYQPRKKTSITIESIQDLVNSIREHGILQPVLLRRTELDRYELIAGERRLRAALELQLDTIPSVIKDIDSRQAYAIAIIENIQREQLSLLEEAEALLKLKNDYLMSVETVAKMIGKPRTTIANLIRVATHLSDRGKELLERGLLDYGHIRTVLSLEENIQDFVLNYIIEHGLSVRESEKFVREYDSEKVFKPNPSNHITNPMILKEEVDRIVQKLSIKYKTNVSFKIFNNGKVRVSMDFIDLDSLKKDLFVL